MIPSLIAAGLFPNKAAAVLPGALIGKADAKPTLLEQFRLHHAYTLAGHRSHSSHSSHGSHRSSSSGGYSTRSYTPSTPTYRPPTNSAPSTPTYVAPSTPSTSSSGPRSSSSLGILDQPSTTYDDPYDWEVVGVDGTTAWLRKKNSAAPDLTMVNVGQEVSGLGTILSIQQSGGAWTVSTDAGLILEGDRAAATRNSDSVPNSSILPSSPSVAPKVLPGNSDKFMKIVVQVQTALFTYGYYTSSIDGMVGPQTRVALSKMQSDYGLKVTGTVTPEVLDALGIAAR